MKLFKQCFLILGMISYGVIFSNPEKTVLNNLAWSLGLSVWIILPWIICNKIKGH
jgi:hypothetical protein